MESQQCVCTYYSQQCLCTMPARNLRSVLGCHSYRTGRSCFALLFGLDRILRCLEDMGIGSGSFCISPADILPDDLATMLLVGHLPSIAFCAKMLNQLARLQLAGRLLFALRAGRLHGERSVHKLLP